MQTSKRYHESFKIFYLKIIKVMTKIKVPRKGISGPKD